MNARLVGFVVMPVFAAALTLGTSSGLAQQATTVQLPTFSFQTVNTTVSVPDGGTAVLGGVNRAATGSTSRGVPFLGNLPFAGRGFRNRGIGYDRSSGMMSATVQIIDFQELEEQLMGGQIGAHTGHTAAAVSPVERRANRLSRSVARPQAHTMSVDPPPQQRTGPTAEDIRRRNVLARQERSEEAVFFFEKGESAEAAGKDNVAKIYYRMAAKRATGDFKHSILAKLDAFENSDSSRIASSR